MAEMTQLLKDKKHKPKFKGRTLVTIISLYIHSLTHRQRGQSGGARAAPAELLNHPLDQKVITIGDHRRPHMVSDGCAVYYIKLILDHFGSTIFLYWHSKGIPNSQYHNGTSMQYHLTTIGDHVSTNGDHLTTMIW